MGNVTITTYGHACFMLEYQGYRIVLDPYANGKVPGCPDLHLEAETVYCSHQHGDHNYTDAVKLTASGEKRYLPMEFVTPHDDQNGKLRGMNTVRIFDFDGIRVAHLGDIGCFPEADLASALEGVDCMLIPVGGHYTIGTQTAAQIIRSAQPRVAIPMHYRTDSRGFDVISHIDDFVKVWDKVNVAEDSFILTPETEKQILVLNYNIEGE